MTHWAQTCAVSRSGVWRLFSWLVTSFNTREKAVQMIQRGNM